MKNLNKKKYIIRYSCITGKAVWVYRNLLSNSIWWAYHRASKYEEERMRGWSEIVTRRKANIQRLLSNLMASLSVNDNLSEDKKNAAKQIAAIADKPPVFYSDFMDHIKETKRRQSRHG